MLLLALMSGIDFGILMPASGLNLGPLTIVQLTDSLAEVSYSYLFGTISLGPRLPIDLIRILHNGYVNIYDAYQMSCQHHDEERLKLLIPLEVALKRAGHGAHLLFSACTSMYNPSLRVRANELLLRAGLISAMSIDYLSNMSLEAWVRLLRESGHSLPRQELCRWYITIPLKLRNDPGFWMQLDLSRLPVPWLDRLDKDHMWLLVKGMSAYLGQRAEPIALSQVLRHYLDSLQLPTEGRERYLAGLQSYLYSIAPRGPVTRDQTYLERAMTACIWANAENHYGSPTTRATPTGEESTVSNPLTPPVINPHSPHVSPATLDELFLKAFTMEALDPTMCSLVMQLWLTQRPLRAILQMVVSKGHICRGINSSFPWPKEDALTTAVPASTASQSSEGKIGASYSKEPPLNLSTSSEGRPTNTVSSSVFSNQSGLEHDDLVALAQRILTNEDVSWPQMEALFAATTGRSFENTLMQVLPSSLLPYSFYLRRLAPLSWRIRYYRSTCMMPASWPPVDFGPRTYSLRSHLTRSDLIHRVNELLAYSGAFRVQKSSQQNSPLLVVRPCVWLSSPLLLELIELSLYFLLRFGQPMILWNSQYCLAIQGEMAWRAKLEARDLKLMLKIRQQEGTLKGTLLVSNPLILDKVLDVHCQEWQDSVMWNFQTAAWRRVRQEWALSLLFMSGSLCDLLSDHHQGLH